MKRGAGGAAVAAAGFLMLQQSNHYHQLHTEKEVQQERSSAMRNSSNLRCQWVCFARKRTMVFHLATSLAQKTSY
jgi:hypothetical protein